MVFKQYLDIQRFFIAYLIVFSLIFGATSAFALEIVTSASSNYNKERASLNKKFNLRPYAIYLCNNNEDVKQAIILAKKANKKIRIRSGGHNYEAFSNGNDIVIIDVSRMKNFNLSSDKKIATMGAGLLLSEVYNKLWEHKLTIPGGSCSTIGISGLVLGGGISFSSRKMGLTCDSVIEYEMITSDGEVLNIKNNNEYSDLFWACSGGGSGNFGVITQIKFKTHPVDKVTVYRFNLSMNKLQNASDAWFEVLEKAPKELMLFLRFSKKDDIDTISTFGQYFGAPSEVEKILKPLLKFCADKKADFKEVDYIESINYWGGNTPPLAENYKASSLFLKAPLSKQALEEIKQFLKNSEVTNAFVVLDSYGGAISAVNSEKTAFAHRDKLSSVQIMLRWTDDKDRAEQEKLLMDFRKSLAKHTNAESAYANYPDVGIEDWQHAYYGKNYEKLQKIKAKYDPYNLFSHKQGISLP